MNFERGKSVKESIELGIMTKLEKYGPAILAKYHFFHMREETIKEMEKEFEKVLGIPIEVIYKEDDSGSSVTLKIE